VNRQHLRSLQLTTTRFQKPTKEDAESAQVPPRDGDAIAHHGGANAIEIDKFNGRYLLSGGADSTIYLWDLESVPPTNTDSDQGPTYTSVGAVPKSKNAHSFGITDLSFYPFDSAAFLSSSFDKSLKLYDSATLIPSATFALDAPVYSFAVSPIAQHLLVACATQLPPVRLVDLRSGAAAHALAGHAGGVLSVAWSPTEEYVLASGGTDGSVRLWDVRRSAGQLGVLDMDDSVGDPHWRSTKVPQQPIGRGKAHDAAVNGVVWTADGRHIVSTGHDDKMRVWDFEKRANTLANFGPYVKNRHLSRLLPCILPTALAEPGKDMVLFPSEREVLMYEVFEGKLLSRLRVPVDMAGAGAERPLKASRAKDLAWREHSVEFYSAHADGSIRAWKPQIVTDSVEDEDPEDKERKRKRQALDDIYQDATNKRFQMKNEAEH
jgi:DNA excision repair protein ERCC-8